MSLDLTRAVEAYDAFRKQRGIVFGAVATFKPAEIGRETVDVIAPEVLRAATNRFLASHYHRGRCYLGGGNDGLRPDGTPNVTDCDCPLGATYQWLRALADELEAGR